MANSVFPFIESFSKYVSDLQFGVCKVGALKTAFPYHRCWEHYPVLKGHVLIQIIGSFI